MKKVLEYILIALICANLILTLCLMFVKPHVHNIVLDPKVSPTCMASGKTEGVHCSTCGEVLIAQEEIPITDHFIQDRACIMCDLKASDDLSYFYYPNDNSTDGNQAIIGKKYQKMQSSILHVFPYSQNADIIDVLGLGKLDKDSSDFTVKEVIVYDGVDILGGQAFCYFQELKKITLPDTITEIQTWAFTNCVKLSDITIPSSVIYIGAHAFDGCESLKSINIPDGITVIEKGTFLGCSGLTSLELPSSVESIGDDAFRNCNRLQSINIGYPREIGASVFAFCNSLEEIVVSTNINGLKNISKAEGWDYEIPDNCKIVCTDGEITISEYKQMINQTPED